MGVPGLSFELTDFERTVSEIVVREDCGSHIAVNLLDADHLASEYGRCIGRP